MEFELFKNVKGEIWDDLLDKNEIDDKLTDEIYLKLIEYFKVNVKFKN